MPRIGLKVECQLENLATFECPGDDFRWFLKVCCGNCGEITDWVYATSEEQIPVKGGRGYAHLVLNCKLCGRESNLTIEEGSVKAYNGENGDLQQLVSFDCRGLEPVEWECRGGWLASAESGRKFDVELEDGEWYDYDDNANASISITGIREPGLLIN